MSNTQDRNLNVKITASDDGSIDKIESKIDKATRDRSVSVDLDVNVADILQNIRAIQARLNGIKFNDMNKNIATMAKTLEKAFKDVDLSKLSNELMEISKKATNTIKSDAQEAKAAVDKIFQGYSSADFKGKDKNKFNTNLNKYLRDTEKLLENQKELYETNAKNLSNDTKFITYLDKTSGALGKFQEKLKNAKSIKEVEKAVSEYKNLISSIGKGDFLKEFEKLEKDTIINGNVFKDLKDSISSSEKELNTLIAKLDTVGSLFNQKIGKFGKKDITFGSSITSLLKQIEELVAITKQLNRNDRVFNVSVKGLDETQTKIDKIIQSTKDLSSALTNLGSVSASTGMQSTSQFTELDSLLKSITQNFKMLKSTMEIIGANINVPQAVRKAQFDKDNGKLSDLKSSLDKENDIIQKAYTERAQILSQKTGIIADSADEMRKILSDPAYVSVLKTGNKNFDNGTDVSRATKAKVNRALSMLEQYISLGGKIDDLDIKGLDDSSSIYKEALKRNKEFQKPFEANKANIQVLSEEIAHMEQLVQIHKEFLNVKEQEQSNTSAKKSEYDSIIQDAKELLAIEKERLDVQKQLDDTSKDEQKPKQRKPNKNAMSEDEYDSISETALRNAKNLFTERDYQSNLDLAIKQTESGLVKISAYIKDANDDWYKFSANVNKDGNLFKTQLKSIENVSKMEDALTKANLSKINLSADEMRNTEEMVRTALKAKGLIDDKWQINVDSTGLVTIINKMEEANQTAGTLKQIFNNAEDAINNFEKTAKKSSYISQPPKEKLPTVGEINEERKRKESLKAEEEAKKKAEEEAAIAEEKRKYEEKTSQKVAQAYDFEIERNKKRAKDNSILLQNQMKQKEKLDQFKDWEESLKRISSIEDKYAGSTGYLKILPTLEKVKTAFREINSEIEKGDSADFTKIEKSMKDISSSVSKVKTAFDKLEAPVGDLGQRAAQKTTTWMNSNTRALKVYGDELTEIIELQKKAKTMGELDVANNKFNALTSSARANGLVGKGWKDSLKSTFGLVTEMFGSFSLVNRADDIVRDMVGTIREVDDALTDLKMATNVSDSQAESLMETYSKMGRELKATGVDVSTAATDFMKQGETIANAQKLAHDSIVLSKVGDLSAEESTKYLTSAMKGYKVEAQDALSIVDKLSAVDMASATDVGGLAEAMSKTAVTAKDAGISMEKLLGYIATVGEVTQSDMGSVGNAFKTIFTRMSNIKAGKLELIDEDGTTELLSDVELTLKNVGIDLRKTVTDYNNYGDVLDNLADKWDGLSQVQQNALSKAFAGTRQAEVFRVLMKNYDSAKEYMETAAESSGFAMEKFGSYQESLSGKIEGFKNSFQSLSNTFVGSDFLKGIVDAGTGALDILDSLIEKFGVLSSLGAGLGIYQGFQGGG